MSMQKPTRVRIITTAEQLEPVKAIFFRAFDVVDVSPARPEEGQPGNVRAYLIVYPKESER